MKERVLDVGKIDHGLLTKLLSYTSLSGPSLIVPAGVGEDAAVIEWGDRYLLVSTDPITFTTQRGGWYAVWINANDIAACGGVPKYFTLTLILPEGRATEGMVEEIFRDTSAACEQYEILWIGGHSEISPSVNVPLLVGQMLGDASAETLHRSSDAVPGDRIILTKAAGIEGTSIIASERADDVIRSHGEAFWKRCKEFLHDPGISILKEAGLLSDCRIHAMHDPTEGGIATGLKEICLASDCGAVLYEGHVPVREETRILCRQFGIDPLGLISSGALMVTAAETEAERIMGRLQGSGIPASIIGEITEKEEGMKILRKDGSLDPLPDFPCDEVAKCVASSIK